MGNIYGCLWEKTSNGFSLQLEDYPDLRSVGKHFFVCEDEIYEKIQYHLGDFNGSIFFPGGLPEEVLSERFSKPDYFILMGNYGCNLVDLGDYYEKGICEVCGHANGKRNQSNFTLTVKAKGTDVILVDKSNAIIFSERIVKCLEKYNSKFFVPRPVEIPRNLSKCFYELEFTDEIMSLDSISVRGEDIGDYNAWKCSSCSARGGFYRNVRGFSYYANRQPLITKKPAMFLFNWRRLCVERDVIDAIKELKPKNLNFEKVGMVSERDIEPNPIIEVRRRRNRARPKLP